MSFHSPGGAPWQEILARTLRSPVSFPERQLDDTAQRLSAAYVSGKYCLLFRQVPFDFHLIRHGVGSATENGILALEFISALTAPCLSAQAGIRVARYAATEIAALLGDSVWLHLEHEFALKLATGLPGMPHLSPLPQIGINIVPDTWCDGILVHKTTHWHPEDASLHELPGRAALTLDLLTELSLERCTPLQHDDDGKTTRHFALRAQLRSMQIESPVATTSTILQAATPGRLARLRRIIGELGGWATDRIQRPGIHAGITTASRYATLLASRPSRMPNPGPVHGGNHVVLPCFAGTGVVVRQYGSPDNGVMRLTEQDGKVGRSDTAHRFTLLMDALEAPPASTGKHIWAP